MDHLALRDLKALLACLGKEALQGLKACLEKKEILVFQAWLDPKDTLEFLGNQASLVNLAWMAFLARRAIQVSEGWMASLGKLGPKENLVLTDFLAKREHLAYQAGLELMEPLAFLVPRVTQDLSG